MKNVEYARSEEIIRLEKEVSHFSQHCAHLKGELERRTFELQANAVENDG